MIMILNCLALFLLSLVPSQETRHDPFGMRAIVEDPALRKLLLEGHFGEYGASIDAVLSERLSLDLSGRARRGKGSKAPGVAAIRDALHSPAAGEAKGILGVLKGALAIATFVTELQTLGPMKAMAEAVRWVEEGIIRRSGLKPQEFPSFFQIISRPEKPRLDNASLRALDSDLGHATSLMDSSYSQLLDHLGEMFF